MGLIKTLIIIAICVAIFGIVFNFIQFPQDGYDCLEEIAEDYCEDNNMILYKVHSNFLPVRPGDFSCKENDRSTKLKFYNFLEDEIEECKNE